MSHNRRINIAIDGFSGCGKSTLAKDLAKRLEYIHIDSGAMYRAITFYFLTHNVDYNNSSVTQEALSCIHLRFIFQDQKSVLLLNDKVMDQQIRSSEVNEHVSPVAAIPMVRSMAVSLQHEMGEKKGIVMDGRDIGTVVFPKAGLKLFVIADIDIRVQRRHLELQQNGVITTTQSIRENLLLRDKIDSTRAHSPLSKADDAVAIDNSNLTTKEQLDMIVALANCRISGSV